MNDTGEKTFEATPRRIARARREGNLARSSEIAAAISFGASGLAVTALVPLLGSAAAKAIVQAASFTYGREFQTVLLLSLVPLATASLSGVVANLGQHGGLVFVSVGPKAERLNPIEGIKRTFSRETIGHSLRATLAFACATFVTLPILSGCVSALVRSASLLQTADLIWLAARQCAFAIGAVGLIFAVAEYGVARAAWLRRLRMSFEERKRDLKEEEGDALARGRRRFLHRSLLKGGIGRINEAAFVVVNPTQLAVALAYRPPRIPVPEVLVQASDAAAARVRALAVAYRVPIIENVALARALYRDGRAGEPIPPALYVVVAEVVAGLIRSEAIAP